MKKGFTKLNRSISSSNSSKESTVKAMLIETEHHYGGLWMPLSAWPVQEVEILVPSSLLVMHAGW